MNKYKLIIEYDGSNFVGWQRQENGMSIQESIEDAIKKLSGEDVTIFGAGRTDAGVHAKGQVAHFELLKDFDIKNIRDGINNYLQSSSISILSVEKVENNFHARFSANQRIYEYKIINRLSPLTYQKQLAWLVYKKLDIKSMQEASVFFIGKHDFNAFRSTNCQSSSSIKTIDDCSIINQGELISISIAAKSFLHSQVRIMVGSLVEVGKSKIQPIKIKEIIKDKNRNNAGITAPPHGLYLKKIIY